MPRQEAMPKRETRGDAGGHDRATCQGPPHRREDRLGAARRPRARGRSRRPGLPRSSTISPRCASRGSDVIVVSSGAIALGRRSLGLATGRASGSRRARPPPRSDRSRSPMPGRKRLRTHDIVAAQILVTLKDTEERRRYLNARSTLSTLLAQGAVPVINENDTVATSEIRYGDNDRLAARVASMMSADCLVLLSDVDGLYTAPPGTEGAEFIPRGERDHARDRGDGRQAGLGRGLGRHDHQDRGGQDRARRRLQHGDRVGPCAASAAAHPRGEHCTWFLAAATPLLSRASAGSPGRSCRWAGCSSMKVPPARLGAARACFPPASAASKAALRAAMR